MDAQAYRYEHYDPQSKVPDVRGVPLGDLGAGPEVPFKFNSAV